MQYRKRIKIAPGVHINLSKSGISTTVGVRGASMTFGKKGTYVNMGIPGTGIYQRKKISSNNSVSSHNSFSTTQSRSNSANNNSGCATAAIIAGFLLLGALGYDMLRTEDTKLYGIISLGIAIIGLIIYIICILTKKTEKQSTKNNKSNNNRTSVELIANNEEQYNIDIANELKDDVYLNQAKQALNQAIGVKKDILQNFITCYEASKEIELETAIIDGLKESIAKKETEKKQILLSEHESKLLSAKQRITDSQFNADSDMTEEEKKKYSEMCQRFEALMDSERIWYVSKREANTQLKSSAATLIQRDLRLHSFNVGVFNYIKSEFDIPTITNGQYRYYLYPKFIIRASSLSSFGIVSYTDATIVGSIDKFQEEGIQPSDSKVVSYTWKYLNKNGEPDRRYSDNKQIPVMLYETLRFSFAGDEFEYQFSNQDSASLFEFAYKSFVGNNSYKCEISYPSDFIQNQKVTPQSIDERCYDAAKLVVSHQKASPTMLQRMLGMGYAKAIRVIDQLESLYIIGPQIGTEPRKVLIQSLEEIEKIFDPYYDRSQQNIPPNQRTINHISQHITPQNNDKYSEVSYAIYNLCFFLEEINRDDEVINAIQKQTGLDNLDGLKTAINPRLFYMVLRDISILYDRFHYDIKTDAIEGSCYAAIIGEMQSGKHHNPQIIKELIGKYIEAKEYLTPSVYPTDVIKLINFDKGLTLLSAVLSDANVDRNIIDKYEVLLYRLANAIVKIDGKVEPHEAKVLEEMLKPQIVTKKPNDNKESKKTNPRKGDAEQRLNELIGLKSVKDEITKLTNFIKVQKLREEKGLTINPISYHCVFTGNPGTGKTTVARIVAELYKNLGILKQGQLVETDRSGLIAEYVGQTAIKTNKLIDSALDGVLFIDEAYSLTTGSNNDFGAEAIATLLKRMEDDRDRLVVILAGYSDDMKQFIDSNPGLQSRFNRYIEFPDYSAEEMMEILNSHLKKNEYVLSDEAKANLNQIFINAVAQKDKNFGNGRYVRNIMEKIIEKQATRLAPISNVTIEMLQQILVDDIPE